MLEDNKNSEGMVSYGCSYSREQLVNHGPSFNMKLLNSEQVENIKKYGLKCSFKWTRGKAKYGD